MDLDNKHLSIRTALRFEFETATQDRAIEIYVTAVTMKYTELASEMASDILHEFNITL